MTALARLSLPLALWLATLGAGVAPAAAQPEQKPAGMARPNPAEIVLTVPGVSIASEAAGQTWVSCKAPVAAILRVQATSESDATQESFRPPRRVEAGRWATWELPIDATWGEAATVRLYLNAGQRQPAGAVFVVSQGPRPTPVELNAVHGRTGFQPNPARPPRDQAGAFTFGISRDADVRFTVQPGSGAAPQPLYERLLRDLPKGQHTVRWNLKARDRGWAPAGRYIARFAGTAREGSQRLAHVVVYFTVAR